MSKRIPPLPPVNQPKADESRDRIPTAPNADRIAGIVSAMGLAAAQYCQMNNGTMADVLSACFTMTHRTIFSVLYENTTVPPLNVREQFNIRKIITGGVERLWNLAAGGGVSSKFKAH